MASQSQTGTSFDTDLQARPVRMLQTRMDFKHVLFTVCLATTRIAPLAARSYQPPPSVSPASTFEIEAWPPPRSGDQHARAERRVTQAEADGGAARCAAIGASRAAALAAVAAWLAPIYTPRPGASVREEQQRWPPPRRSLYENTGGAHLFSSHVSASLKSAGCL